MEDKLDEKNNSRGRGIFYAVIGISTLIVAIVGATFAYFTASQNTGNGVISGNMANIEFDLVVEKVLDPGASSGLIPLSNSMVETAINDTTDTTDLAVNDTCVDDNGNAVCQIYKITVTNNSSAVMFVDGYVALAGGSGIPIDFTNGNLNHTTMRWAQVFKIGNDSVAENVDHYSTAGRQYLAINRDQGSVALGSIDNASDDGFNRSNILTQDMISSNEAFISGNYYDAVSRNYIRVSNHKVNDEGFIDLTVPFARTTDLTSLLVINQQLAAVGDSNNRNRAIYYFVVWLSENGHNQTAGQTATSPSTTTNPSASNFYNGIVRFISAQGSEVTATFTDYTAVRSDNA